MHIQMPRLHSSCGIRGVAQPDACIPPHVLKLLPQSPEQWEPPSITGLDLAMALSRMRLDCAPGCDGWQICELRALPGCALRELASLFNRAEQLALLPSLFQTALVTLIPKQDSWTCTPSSLRPISIFPATWRMYTKVRFQHLMLHADGLLHPWQHGGRIGRSAIVPAMMMGLHIDNAFAGGSQLFGISIDLVKMFDTLPWSAADQILCLWGVPASVRLMWMRHFQHSKAHYKVSGGFYSAARDGKRGLPQGDSLSVALANGIMTAIAFGLAQAYPEDESMMASLYIDDLHIVSTSPSQLAGIVAVVEEITQSLGMSLSMKKSQVWTTCHATSKKWTAEGTPCGLQQTHSFRILGAHYHLRGPRTAQADNKAALLTMTRQRCRRVSTLPIPRKLRSHIASIMVIPKLFYAPVDVPFNKQQDLSITTQLSIASSGNRLNNCEARELEWAAYRPLHLHHAPSARLVRLISLTQLLYQHNPVGVLMQLQHYIKQWFGTGIGARRPAHGASVPHGPVSSLCCSVKQAGLQLVLPATIIDGLVQMPLLWQQSPHTQKEWQQLFRDFLRCFMLRSLASRRPLFLGVQAGISRALTVPKHFPPHVLSCINSAA